MGMFGSIASKIGKVVTDKKEKIGKAYEEIFAYSSDKYECLKYGCDMIGRVYEKDMLKGMGYANACRKLASENDIRDEQLKELYDELHQRRNAYALNAIAGSMQNRGLITRDENGYHRNW